MSKQPKVPWTPEFGEAVELLSRTPLGPHGRDRLGPLVIEAIIKKDALELQEFYPSAVDFLKLVNDPGR